mmetsp:Transcript_21135/g.36273  ORF Transcript_21135/g.36273 Transcript_21135/m.36273 type:complete len:89 (+) Transcript_21135:1047-1313(+)
MFVLLFVPCFSRSFLPYLRQGTVIRAFDLRYSSVISCSKAMNGSLRALVTCCYLDSCPGAHRHSMQRKHFADELLVPPHPLILSPFQF